ncbi:hypothetical protein MNBD_GAMMA22-3012 [hydrothermal vent metagenome]|uniref:Thioredoxin domain-containing protein n=1 Tax=hydrothermal vent metagenome TaxID=652676 RepID=A0A3B0ZC54_9ZZZZ
MKNKTQLLFFIIAILTLNTSQSAEISKSGESQHLLYNQDILLQDFSGKNRNINEFTGKGKWLLVMIWASNCHICNAEIQNYIKFNNKHKNKDLTVLGISVDGWQYKDNALEFIRKHKVDFTNLIAAPVVIDHFYKLQTGKSLVGTPSFLLYSPTGELKAEQSGAVPTALIEDFIKKNSKNSSGSAQ